MAPTDTDHTTDTDAADAAAPQAPETPAAGDDADDGGRRTAADYEAEIRRLRREAAKKRVELNELGPRAEQADQRIAELEAQNQALQLGQAVAAAAAEHGVPAGLIHGNTAEEAHAHAEALAKWLESETTAAVEAAVPHAPHVPGENTGRAPAGDTDWLRAAMARRR